MFNNAKMNDDGILDVPAKDLWEKKSEVEIVDVRADDEFVGELGHVPGAKHVHLQTAFLNELKDFDLNKTYVFVCRSGGRSTKAALMAQAHGIKSVYNLKGGMIHWNELGLETEK